MKTIIDPPDALGSGLAALRVELQVPAGFPPAVLAAAAVAARRQPADHRDRTERPFVTLDPATATDLDQAFAIERAGADLLLHYAIADVGWFVADGDPLDREARARGETLYLPDGKASLYPPVLSEGAASLLPSGPRPAVVFTVRVASDGAVRLDGVERALIRSRAKLSYEAVTPADLPAEFADLSARIAAAETGRGASRVDPPEQEVARMPGGGYALAFSPRLLAETQNAALSLATNLAVADLLQAHRTGLFRVMPAPDARGVARLRHGAAALGLAWPAGQSLEAFTRTLSGEEPREAAFMLSLRRASPGASYAGYRADVVPWHAAMAATYCHATAPLRRLADRFVIEAALAVANGRAVPRATAAALAEMSATMARADALAGKVNRAVIDLAEAAMLEGRVGETFAAVVTESDDHGARIQLRELAVTARLLGAGLVPGQLLTVRLTAADPVTRTITFARPA